MSEKKTTYKRLGTKLLSLTLSAALVCSMFPAAKASAAEEPQTPGENTASTTITVKSFSKLNERFLPSATEENVYSLAVKPDTPLEDLQLPEKLEAKVEEVKDSNGVQYSKETKTEKVAVTWDGSKEYRSDENGEFIYTAELPAGYTLADGLELPRIYVFVGRQARGVKAGEVPVGDATAFKSAFASAVDGDTITVTADIDLGTAGVILDGDKAITLNLNGKKVTYSGTVSTSGAIKPEGSASLTVTDTTSKKEGKLEATGPAGCAIYNNGDGAVTVSSGIVQATGTIGYAITSIGAGTITVTGGTVQATGEGSVAIYNFGTGAINVTGGTVQATASDGNAIYNYNTGKITISGTARVTSDNASTAGGTIYVMYGAPLILDVQGGTVSNTASPDEGYSVYFEDTTVTSANLKDYYQAADGATVGKTYPASPAAEITKDGTTTAYPTLAEAFAAAADGDTIKVTSDVDLGSTNITIDGSKSITLNLNGKTVTSSSVYDIDVPANTITLVDSASLTVTDTTSEKNGKLEATTNQEHTVINNDGTGAVTVAGGTVKANGKYTKTILNGRTNTGTVNVSGGTVASTGKEGCAIYNGSAGTVNVTGGDVQTSGAKGKAINTVSIDGAVNVSGGIVAAFVADGFAIYNSETGKITISGTARVTSDNASTAGGTIYVMYGAPLILDIQGGTVSNGALPNEGYSVYFEDTTVTSANLKDYYQAASGATVGKTYPASPAAEITKDGTTTAYPTLAEAFAAATSGDTIKVTSDVDLKTTGIGYQDKAITLDLNGKTVTFSGTALTSGAINPEGTASLTVTDTTSKKEGKLEATGKNGRAIYNGSTGAVTASGGTVQATGEAGYAIYNNGTGAINVTGGTVQATAANGNAIFNMSTGKITISGTANVTSKSTGTTSATIYLFSVPTSGDKMILDIQGGTVSNTASPDEGYSVYFKPTSVTSANLKDYYQAASGATVGKTYPASPAAEITKDGTTTAYPTLADAFAGASNNDTIKVTSGVDLKTTGITYQDKAITLDLNGKKVTYSGIDNYSDAFKLEGSASLTVTDTTSEKNGKLEATGGYSNTINNAGTGAVTVSDGTVVTTGIGATAIFNSSTGAVNVAGGTVQATNMGGYAILNAATGAITISGGTVQAIAENGCAISNSGTGAITVSGGTVQAKGFVGLAISNDGTGKITISGEKTLITSENANTEGGTIYLLSVPSSGDKMILDVQGGTVSNTASPEGYSVYFDDLSVTADNLKDYYQAADGAKVGKTRPAVLVVEITKDGTTKKYATLAEAFEAATSGDTIKVISDVDLKTTGIRYKDKAITLDLNGKTVTYSGISAAVDLFDGASLTVTDSTSEKNGKLEATGKNGAAINNGGTSVVTVSGGTVEATASDGIAIRSGGTSAVNVTGGTVRATGKNGAAINNGGTSVVTVSGGTVEATGEYGKAIGSSSDTGAVNVTGGTVRATGKDGTAILNVGAGIVMVTGGTVQATSANSDVIRNQNGSITVAGGTVRTTGEYSFAINNYNTGVVTVSGGTVEATSEYGKAIGSSSDTGTVNVTGGTVQATASNGVAIDNGGTGKITISGTANVTSKSTGTTSGTIYLQSISSSASTVLDVQGGKVTNTASPEGYSVYFADKSVTTENVKSYYSKANGATVGKVHPTPKTSGGGGSSSEEPAPKPAPDKGIVVDDNSGTKDILDATKPTATVDVKIYSGTSNSDIIPDAKIFTDIKTSGKNVIMPVKDAAGKELYSITLNGDWMKTAPVQVNSMNFGAAVTKTAQGTEFSMRHTGFVPGGMVKVGLPGFTAGTQQYVYEIDAATGARVEIALTTADASGKVSFYAADGGKYVVTSTRDTARYGAASDTRAPVGVAKGGSYTFKFTVENGQEAKFSVGTTPASPTPR